MLDIAWSHAHLQSYALSIDCILHTCAENTNLTSIEQPRTASPSLVEFTYTSNVQTSGDIPQFLGSLTNLTTLNLDNNGFNGSIPGELYHLLIPDRLGEFWLFARLDRSSCCIEMKPRASCDSHTHVR